MLVRSTTRSSSGRRAASARCRSWPTSACLAFPHTLRGGVFVHPDDFNPERIILDDEVGFDDAAGVDVRDRLGTSMRSSTTTFSNFKYMRHPRRPCTAGNLQREVTQSPKKDELAVASMNVENLDPTDPPASSRSWRRSSSPT